MEIKLNYCCKRLREYLQGSYDINFSIKNGYFYWENHDYDEDLVMDYCPFCGKKLKTKTIVNKHLNANLTPVE